LPLIFLPIEIAGFHYQRCPTDFLRKSPCRT
jgi:hypothetical protein